MKAAEAGLAAATGICGLVAVAHGLRRKDWGIVYSGAGLILCAVWLLMRTL